MTALDLRRLTARFELIETELANRAEHREARLTLARLLLAHEALVDQGCDPLQHVDLEVDIRVAHHLGRLEREAAGEDREPTEERAFALVEQVVAPGDRTAQGLLAGREVTG